jgi:energy-coupling factor transport system ATP-binding protein
MHSSPLIDIESIWYSYSGQKRPGTRDDQELRGVQPVLALQDVSLQIWPGEYIVILGHNGSGKSTLARHCNALVVPDRGRVLVDGLDTRDEASQRAIRDRVGMILQNPDNQIIATIVQDDVAWGLAVRGMPAPLIRERVSWALSAVDIAHLHLLPPHKLSGGQRQRLAIAGVLAVRPHCIIADEATSMLDPLSRQEITELLHQLNREHGLTIIQVTHFLEEAALAQRVVVMERGQIILEGSPAAIFADLERLRALNLAIPEPVALAARLRDAGFPIARDAVTLEALARELLH